MRQHPIRPREAAALGWTRIDPEGRMVTTGALMEGQPSKDDTGPISRFKHGTAWPTLREAMEWVAKEVAPPPFVCPGCHAVGGERCAPGCIDAEIEREHREAIESGDYDRTEDGDA